jgi:hypothetical protein
MAELIPVKEGDAAPASRSRRRLLGNAFSLPLLAFLGSVASWPGLLRAAGPVPALGAARAAALQRMLYLLYPYPELGAGVYERALGVLEERLAGAAEQLAMVDAGLVSLDAAAGGSWIGQPEEDQVRAMAAIENSPFFQFMLGHAQATIFNDEETWQLIGYEGSSLDFGGYGDRLSEIDWLDGQGEG